MRRRSLSIALLALALAGCGGSASGGGASSPKPPLPAVAAAAHPRTGEFPAADGRTLQQVANGLDGGGPQVALATSVYTPGVDRLAFGAIDPAGAFLYGETAVYVARAAGAPARGPYLAPADSLAVRAPFRSRTSAQDTADVKAVYHADVALPAAGRWVVLAVTRVRGRLLGGVGGLTVVRRSAIPAVGRPAPRIHTPTLASVGGDAARIDTRVPPDSLHDADLYDVLGRRPVMLLFATPALCRSRVCGPVVDEAVQLASAYGDRVAFIHNEVYVDNDPSKGLRPQLRAFGLESEPWLFAIDRHGRVAARLEGAFGLDEFRAAVEAALRGAPARG